MDALFVALGGAVGAVTRYVVQMALAGVIGGYPLGTTVVNVVGCFVIGVLVPLMPGLPAATRPLVVTGFLGGLTTMSSYAGEVVGLAHEGNAALAAMHWAGGAIACVTAAALGWWLASRVSA